MVGYRAIPAAASHNPRRPHRDPERAGHRLPETDELLDAQLISHQRTRGRSLALPSQNRGRESRGRMSAGTSRWRYCCAERSSCFIRNRSPGACPHPKVVIIGAGIVGTSLADELTARGCSDVHRAGPRSAVRHRRLHVARPRSGVPDQRIEDHDRVRALHGREIRRPRRLQPGRRAGGGHHRSTLDRSCRTRGGRSPGEFRAG